MEAGFHNVAWIVVASLGSVEASVETAVVQVGKHLSYFRGLHRLEDCTDEMRTGAWLLRMVCAIQ